MSCPKHPKYTGMRLPRKTRSPRAPDVDPGDEGRCDMCMGFYVQQREAGVKEVRKKKEIGHVDAPNV